MSGFPNRMSWSRKGTVRNNCCGYSSRSAKCRRNMGISCFAVGQETRPLSQVRCHLSASSRHRDSPNHLWQVRDLLPGSPTAAAHRSTYNLARRPAGTTVWKPLIPVTRPSAALPPRPVVRKQRGAAAPAKLQNRQFCYQSTPWSARRRVVPPKAVQ
jgi:hypothetical protein